jgi:hypothetical protein
MYKNERAFPLIDILFFSESIKRKEVKMTVCTAKDPKKPKKAPRPPSPTPPKQRKKKPPPPGKLPEVPGRAPVEV